MATLQDVLALARRGVPVFPLRSGTKDGFLNDASDHGATTDKIRLYEVFSGNNYNFGCWGGGRFVYVDVESQGLTDWETLVAEIGGIPETFTVQSARGGIHLYFDAGGETFSQAPLIKGKVDIRSAGGYVVGPGSEFTDPRTGVVGKYTIVDASPIAPLPGNLRQRLRLRQKPTTDTNKIVSDLDTPAAIAKAQGRLDWAPGAITGQGGNNETYALACALLDLGLTADKACELMLASPWNARCLPPWQHDELRVTVENAWNYKQSSIGRDNPADGFSPMPAHMLRALSTLPTPAAVSLWDFPDMSVLRLNRAAPPKMPLQCFGALTNWITEQAEAKGAPADYVVAGVLSACSALIGSSRRARVHDGWSEPSILWNALIGSPSTNKSPALDAVLEPLGRIERRMTFDFASTLRDYKGRKLAAKTHYEKWERDVRSAVTAGRPPPPMPPDAEEPPEPTRRRIKVNDATVEALSRELAQGYRLLFCRDELAGWLGNLDRYGGNGGDKPFYIETYGGRSHTVDRIKNDQPLHIKFMNLPIVGGIQPDKLDTMLLKADDDGLTARFLMYWPERAPLTRSRARPDNTVIEHIFQRLLALQLSREGEPVEVPLSAPAGEAFHRWRVHHHETADEPEGMHASSLGKNPGHVVRIALILEHMQWAAGNSPTPPTEISLDAFIRSARLVEEYFKPMAARVLGGVTGQKVERVAAVLAREIRKRGTTEINLREVRRKWGVPQLKDDAALDAACMELQDAGWLAKANAAKVGRPGKSFNVNPLVHERTASS